MASGEDRFGIVGGCFKTLENGLSRAWSSSTFGPVGKKSAFHRQMISVRPCSGNLIGDNKCELQN
jgi:hypothetical protein